MTVASEVRAFARANGIPCADHGNPSGYAIESWELATGRHYKGWRQSKRGNRHATVFDAFLSRVHKTEKCWDFTGHLNAHGYGVFSDYRDVPIQSYAHRRSWQLHRGTIPEGMTLDHLCRNRRCVNPDHLEVVTLAENSRRASRPRSTACRQGHEEWSVYQRRNGTTSRVCRPCKRQYDKDRARRAA